MRPLLELAAERDRGVRHENRRLEHDRRPGGQHAEGEQHRDQRDSEGDATLERERVALDAHASAHDRAQPDHGCEVEDVRADDDADPTAFAPVASATIAVESSGASAPSAVSRPSGPSGRPSRSPRWSSRSANTAAAYNVATSETRKTTAARPVDNVA